MSLKILETLFACNLSMYYVISKYKNIRTDIANDVWLISFSSIQEYLLFFSLNV